MRDGKREGDVKRDAEKETFWRKTMAEAGSSGQSLREFCRQRGIKENLFYAWRRELRLRDAEQGKRAGFVELVPAQGRKNEPAGVSVRMGDRISIVLECGFDPAALKAVLAAVGEVATA